MVDPARVERRCRHPLLLAAAGGSAVLYGVAYLVQRSIAMGRTQVIGVPLLIAHIAVTLALFALYLIVLALCRRRPLVGRWLALALGAPVAAQLLLLFALPTLSIDVLSYLAHGYIQAELQGNPYLIPASAAAAAPLGPELVAYGWRPVHPVTSYGPLWTHIEAVVAGTVEGTLAQLFVLKGVVVAASLGSAGLIWMILGRVAPQDQRLGTLAWLWNPVVVMELAVDGHNDALVVLIVMLGLASALQGRGEWLSSRWPWDA